MAASLQCCSHPDRGTGISLQSRYEQADNTFEMGYIEQIIERLGISQKKYSITFLKTADFSVFFEPEDTIYISDRLFNINLSEDELAFILAHEIAHDIFRHSSQLKDSLKTRQRLELEADNLGQKIILNAGYTNRARSAIIKVCNNFVDQESEVFCALRLSRL